MAIEDFFGIWDVQLTSGTPFGIGSRVVIDPSPLSGNRARLHFESLQNPFVDAVFDPATQALEVTAGLGGPARAMYISRYTDLATGYRAIYGLTICEDLAASGMSWLTVWGAELPPEALEEFSVGESDEVDEAAPDRLLASSFDGTYKAGSTTGSQFGVGSELVFKDGGSRITITNGLGNSVSAPESLTFDIVTSSLQGVTFRNAIAAQTDVWSFATFNCKNYIYGLAIVDTTQAAGDDWPEQAGACGAEEEDPNPGMD